MHSDGIPYVGVMHLLAGLQTDTRSHDNHLTESLCTLNFPAASAVSNKFKSTGPASESHCTKAWQISCTLSGPCSWLTPRCKLG